MIKTIRFGGGSFSGTVNYQLPLDWNNTDNISYIFGAGAGGSGGCFNLQGGSTYNMQGGRAGTAGNCIVVTNLDVTSSVASRQITITVGQGGSPGSPINGSPGTSNSGVGGPSSISCVRSDNSTTFSISTGLTGGSTSTALSSSSSVRATAIISGATGVTYTAYFGGLGINGGSATGNIGLLPGGGGGSGAGGPNGAGASGGVGYSPVVSQEGYCIGGGGGGNGGGSVGGNGTFVSGSARYGNGGNNSAGAGGAVQSPMQNGVGGTRGGGGGGGAGIGGVGVDIADTGVISSNTASGGKYAGASYVLLGSSTYLGDTTYSPFSGNDGGWGGAGGQAPSAQFSTTMVACGGAGGGFYSQANPTPGSYGGNGTVVIMWRSTCEGMMNFC